ncbi:MAG: phenylalanine--tRNA ligase subunit beta [Micropruina sp.]|uniref:phenylalanine--tRNA ligase subunit beta n=1 Tax=Micropruina sp. TaxID=2737536 RepID=UPI0039E6B599
MRAPMSWLRDWVALPEGFTGRELAEVLIRAGLEVETVEQFGAGVGPLVVGRVVDFVDQPQKNGKVIRWCHLDVGAALAPARPPAPVEGRDVPDGVRGIICGAHNFAVGDLVVVGLPGTVLAGGFTLTSRKTYGHLSDGMICAEDELGIGSDHSGIIVLPESAGLVPGDDPGTYLGLGDEVLDINVSPDMAYCMSIRGLAREAAQALGVPFTDVVDRAVPAPVADGHPVVLDDPACSLFVALTVTGVDETAPSPRWMQRRLTMAGMRSISLPVDITNYVMLEVGQPLHAYDASKLSGPIRVRKASAGECIVTLDDVQRTLSADDLLITDDSGPIGIAGVMGGATTECDAATTDIVIEAAAFDPSTISRSMRRHGLPSEASKRFERGTDPAATYAAAHLVARHLVELGGGVLSSSETVTGTVPAMPTQRVPVELPSQILGVEVSAARVAEIFRASGVAVSEASDGVLELMPPTWRRDLKDPYDYVEEVGRKIGFDTIGSILPTPPGGRGLTAGQVTRRAIVRALASNGFTELLTLPFGSAEDLDRLGLPADDRRRAVVRLANPLAETSPYLRTSLLPGLLAAVQRNTSRGNDDLALFETGSVFRAGNGVAAPVPGVDGRPSDEELAAIEAALPAQPRHLAAVLTGAWRPAGWDGPAEPASWKQAIAFAELAAGEAGVSVRREADDHAPFHPGRCAKLLVSDAAGGDVLLGHAGELHPSVCKAFGLPARTAAAEISIDVLLAVAPGPGSIASVSQHPVAKEDVALVVAETISAGEVTDALVAGAGDLLESIHLFDIYRGSQIPDGSKSLAFALRFRAPDRTLKDAEIAAARDAAVAEAVRRFDAVQRA